jgi:hypothetical protein
MQIFLVPKNLWYKIGVEEEVKISNYKTVKSMKPINNYKKGGDFRILTFLFWQYTNLYLIQFKSLSGNSCDNRQLLTVIDLLPPSSLSSLGAHK